MLERLIIQSYGIAPFTHASFMETLPHIQDTQKERFSLGLKARNALCQNCAIPTPFQSLLISFIRKMAQQRPNNALI